MSLVCPSPPHLSDLILPILDYFMFLESVSNHKVFSLLSPLPVINPHILDGKNQY